jgi:hypothetical protein
MPGLKVVFVLLGDGEGQRWQEKRSSMQGSSNYNGMPGKASPQVRLENAWKSYKCSTGRAFTANPFKLGEATEATLWVMFVESLAEAEHAVQINARGAIKYISH